MTAIILLNWNGADLTIACLESLSKCNGDKRVVVVDNASEDDSIERLTAWVSFHSSLQVDILQENENWGFARGCNVGIHFARKYNPDSYLLLNNDTEVESDFLETLQNFSAKNPQYVALSPCICYFSDKSKVWFCGGILKFGGRKLLLPNSERSPLTKDGKDFRIEFISGCALYAKAELLDSEGDLLSNRFFFGEEDYEFSLRMKAQKKLMACVPNAVIYHKVGSSRKKMGEKKMLLNGYNYYLGKLIVNRLYMSSFMFSALLFTLGIKSLSFFFKNTGNWRRAFSLERHLFKDAIHKEEIKREDYEHGFGML